MHICRTVLDGADLHESHGSRLPQKCPKIASLDPPRRSKGKEGSLEHFVWKPQCLGGGNNDLKTCQKINVLPARNLPIVRSAVSILNSFLLRKTPLARNNKKQVSIKQSFGRQAALWFSMLPGSVPVASAPSATSSRKAPGRSRCLRLGPRQGPPGPASTRPRRRPMASAAPPVAAHLWAAAAAVQGVVAVALVALVAQQGCHWAHLGRGAPGC